MASSRPHLAIDSWLEKLDLSIYKSLFKQYEGVEDVLWMSERELKDIGIKNGSHRARIGTSLTALKEKYNKANKENQGNQSQHADSLEVFKTSSKSLANISPGNHINLNSPPSGIRSWPSSVPSSSHNTKQSSPRRSMEGNLSTESTAEDLKKALEQELSLDSSDLRSYAWYHGTILRQRAEDLVIKDGDFVVRDCISQPGDYVITCEWNNMPLHFIIKKVIIQPDTVYEKVQYCFEKESFDSIPDFVTYYVGSKCPLSEASGAVITHPINRTMPLSYYASRYGVQCQIHYAAKALEKIPFSPENNKSSPMKSHKLSEDNEKIISAKDMHTDDENRNQTFVEQQIINKSPNSKVPQRSNLIRVGSDLMLSPNTERRILETRPNSGCFSSESAQENASNMEGEKPPPKPSRIPSRRCAQRPFILKRERKVSTDDIESTVPKGISVPRSSIAHPTRIARQMSGETRFSFLDRPSVSDDGMEPDHDISCEPFSIPSLNPPSAFDTSKFRTPLLGIENKPLEGAVLEKVKRFLLSETSHVIACHLTRIDLEIARSYHDVDLGLGVTNGLELLFFATR